MSLLRSDRFPAVMLLAAAAAGLILANSPAREAVFGVADAHVGIPGVIDLSVRHWVSDALLAVFFFGAAIELQYELTRGELASRRKALLPAIAAAGGVIAPIAVYLLLAGGPETASGWPIPTATDIAFALGVLAVFGGGLPSRVRVFLLALAILDDIVGIVFIAVLFTSGVDLGMVVLALALLVVFAVCSRVLDTRWRGVAVALLVVSAVGVWAAVHASGIHATIAGVALGLAMSQQPALRVRYTLEPWINGLILPVFAFSAALVAIPDVSASEFSPVFWGVLFALPVGKLVGITVAGALAQRLLRVPRSEALVFGDLVAAGALGGIGFTVALLMSELAFTGDAALRDQGVLGVLAGSMISLILAVILVSWRAWHHRKTAATIPAT